MVTFDACTLGIAFMEIGPHSHCQGLNVWGLAELAVRKMREAEQGVATTTTQ